MPFFDFKCEQCEKKFEVRVSNAAKDKVRCPNCGGNQIKQLLSPFFAPGSSGGNSCSGSNCSSCGPGCSCH
ncbi:MAG: FmdB family zinc ribbon protein [Methylocystaceae bacterium]